MARPDGGAPPATGGAKRALTHVGGATETRGEPETAEILREALDVESSVRSEEAEDAARAHVHGFHAYAARLHPTTASRLVGALSRQGDVVLDPFCGSGTVLVEARRLGRRAVGVDANPLAVRLATLKVTPADAPFREALLSAARRVADVADARRKARAGATRRHPKADVDAFAPHVLLELDGLSAGLEGEADPRVRQALYLVLSSILVKLGRAPAPEGGEKRIGAGYPARLFVRKAEELARRMEEIEGALAAGPEARVLEGDARELSGIPARSVDLVVSSPPYPGVYDYATIHALRLRWLGLPAGRFDRAEIGARRRARDAPDAAIQSYEDDLCEVLRAAAHVMRPGAHLVFVIADGAVGGREVRTDELLARLADRVGLRKVAIASQERPHFHGGDARTFRARPRREHALALARR